MISFTEVLTDLLPFASGLLVLGLIFVITLVIRQGRQVSYMRVQLDQSQAMQMQQEERFRAALAESIQASSSAQLQTITEIGKQQTATISSVDQRILQMIQLNDQRFDRINQTLSESLQRLQGSNEQKLEQMRQVVDEKLHSTLEKRLGESFKQVSQHLEAVQRGLGEMRSLANGVGDLKRVLTNVKARGTWGEVQLETLLEDLLTPQQYEKNVATKPHSQKRVEFAIKLPGQGDQSIWLPIDAKYPQEDYLRLINAIDAADGEAVNRSRAALLRSIREFAKDISSKYVAPPHTTDFAIMFLPTEGLYAEVLRSPGVVEMLQQDFRIVIAGPVTLSAILNSLRIGFRTLAIEQRSSEVWQILAGVKTEFGKFADVLDKVQKQLHTASSTLEQTGVRTRAMERRLKDVESLDDYSAGELFTDDE